MPNFVLTNQSVPDPNATDATNSGTANLAHHLQHTRANDEIGALGNYFVNETSGTPANRPQLKWASTGNGVTIGVSGSDTNVPITIQPKGTGMANEESSELGNQEIGGPGLTAEAQR